MSVLCETSAPTGTPPASGQTSGDSPTSAGSAAPTAPAAPPVCRRCQWLTGAVVAMGSVFLLALCVWLYTRNNAFPISWHPDEPSKTDQVIDDYRNFKHPQLLLEATRLAVRWLDVRREHQAVGETGRLVSAVFAAGAAVCMAITGYLAGGLTGFVLAGLATAFCPPLLVYAHYMKEDSVLVFGLCLTVLATKVFCDVRHPAARALSLVFLGAACGTAASAKYSGVYALAAVVPLLLVARPWRWFSPAVRVLTVVLAAAAVFAVVNHRIFKDGVSLRNIADLPWPQRYLRPQFIEGFTYERDHGVTQHHGLTMDKPNLYSVRSLVRQCMPGVLALAGLSVVLLAALVRRSGLWDWYVLLFAGGYLLLMSWCVIPQGRYVLPVVVLVHLLAALAGVRLMQLLGRWWRPAAAFGPVLVLALVAAGLIPRCVDFLEQFRDDSRARLRTWVRQNVRSGQTIVQDAYCELPAWFGPSSGENWRYIRVRTGPQPLKQAPGAGSLESLYESGVRYVAVTDLAYGRYFEPDVKPVESERRNFERARQWYKDLFEKHELVWESRPKHPTLAFTNPTIRVYRLRPPVQPAARPAAGATRPAPGQ